MSVTFDDPNLIANAGLLLPGTLAAHLDVQGVIDARVDLSGRVGGANTGIKAMTVVSALLAGAERIDDDDVLRARAWAAGAGPGRTEAVTIDLDSTHCRTYGLAKQGAWKVDRHGERGYHPVVAVCDGYDQVLATRLREGPANDGRGAASFLTETLGRVRTAGARGPVTVRADSGFFGRPLLAACH